MKYLIAAGALTVVAVAWAAPGEAAPTGSVTAAAAVTALESEGFHVILNRTGAVPLDQCMVDSVRPGQTFSRADSGAPGAGSSIVTTVTSKTVYVDVDC